MPQFIRALLADETASPSIEYGLLAAGIAVAIITSVNMTGCSLQALFTRIGDSVSAAG
jgi:pilus assembly protein Flp/PilA